MRMILLLMVLSLIYGCAKEERLSKPNNLISEKVMEDILYDITLINSSKSINPGLMSDYSFKPDDYIYKKYQIDSLQFATSNIYYASKPELFDEIYARVEKRFVDLKIQDSLNEAKKKQNKSKDTVRGQPLQKAISKGTQNKY